MTILVMNTRKRYIAAIDPGITGALAIIDATSLEVIHLSRLEVFVARTLNDGKEVIFVDGSALYDTIFEYAELIDEFIIEDIFSRPQNSGSSMLAFGRSQGIAIGVVQSLGIELSLVPAGEWKDTLGLSSDKLLSKRMAYRLFDGLGKVVSHDKCEALLLAYYQLKYNMNKSNQPLS